MDVSEPLLSEPLPPEPLSSEGRFFARAFYCPGTPPHNIGS